MQRGVDLSDLDVSYVSSLALYFLLMFGLNDVYAILLGEGSEMDEQKMMQMQVRSILSYLITSYPMSYCPVLSHRSHRVASYCFCVAVFEHPII